MHFRFAATVAALAAIVPVARAQRAVPVDTAVLGALRWRSIGPANMAGRVTDLAVSSKDPRVMWVAYSNSGIWRTKNAGTTWTALFDHEKVMSLGALAVAPSNPDVVYAGTGEEDSRNSISPGGGVYKSLDGGVTWQLTGLEATQQVGRIAIHPDNPDIAYVAALGHAWGSNPERGLYKTSDGGKTWQLIKFVSDKAGFVDVAMDPADPNTLWASSWERVRGPWFLNSGGPGSALWKSADAGATWKEVAGGGFPATTKGRIGIAIAASNPKIVYAVVEADTTPNPLAPGAAPDTLKRARTPSGLYRTIDGGATWTMMFRNVQPPGNRGFGDARPFYYSQVRVDPKNPERVYWMSSVFRYSDDGGKTARIMAGSIHTDWHAMWINPADPDHFVIADDGGIAVTRDKGLSFDFVDNVTAGQFYEVSFDMQKPYRVCGGLQDNGSWCGPSRLRSSRPIANADWINVGGGDGFYTAQDADEPNVVYAESQGGNITRIDLASGFTKVIRRSFLDRGMRQWEDSVVVIRGDTLVAATPAIATSLDRIRGRMKADSTAEQRFNWQAPFFLSPHNAKTIYVGGNRLNKSTNRGDTWTQISADLSTRDSMKIKVSTQTTGGITVDNTGAETHGTITVVAESPLRAGILWAGTDDGNVWLTRDDGKSWEELTPRFPGLPANTWVNRVEPSQFDSGTVYVAFDGHRTNDFTPYVYVSTDFGKTFRSIADGLPHEGPGFVHVVREDPHNRNLLFVGTDVGAYVSIDRGTSWTRFQSGLPTVPVHDLRIHPRDRELIAATHGRSIWIADIAPLEQLTDSVLATDANVFKPRTAFQYASRFEQVFLGDRPFRVANAPYGAWIYYRFAKIDTAPGSVTTPTAVTSGPGGAATAAPTPPTPQQAKIVITTLRGDTVRTMTGPARIGVARVIWDLRTDAAKLSPSQARDSTVGARLRAARADSLKLVPKLDSAERAAGRTPPARPPATTGEQAPPLGPVIGGRPQLNVEPGEYVVTITVGTRVLRTTVRVERVGEVGRELDFFGEEGDEARWNPDQPSP